jgi:hypothetical protein
MKQIIIEVEDASYEPLMGMLAICQHVRVVHAGDIADLCQDQDLCFAKAIATLREDGVLRRASDYAYIMMAVNENVIKGLPFFYSPKEFIGYMQQLGFSALPGRTTIYDALARIGGRYPEWTFSDPPTATEIIRRKNIVKRFLNVFLRAHLTNPDGFSDNT